MLKNEKGELYSKIALLKKQQNIVGVTGIRVIEKAREMGIAVEALDLKTPGLRGVAVISDAEKERGNYILLNSNRTPKEQNFDCAHEFMHIYLHRKLRRLSFRCFDGPIAQDTFVEWQANEGAAEYCVPASEFIPIAARKLGDIRFIDRRAQKKFHKEMSEQYIVPEMVIQYRLNNLQYEIWQYMQGVPMGKWEFLSRGEQNRRGINIPSLAIIR